MNLSQITKQLSIRGGCGGGRWRIDPRFFVHSMVDIFLWFLAWDGHFSWQSLALKSGQITFIDRALGKADLFFFLYLTHNVDQSFQIKTHSVYIVVHAIVWKVSKLLLLFHVATFLDISFSSSFLCRCERNFKTEM